MLSGTSPRTPSTTPRRVPVERAYRVSASSVGHGTDLYVLVFKDQSEARRIDRMRADFIANASHELRTPLASISGFIETLRGPARNDPAAREQFLQIMQNQTGRMARLIDDLLSLSRLEMKPLSDAGHRGRSAPDLDSVIDSLGPLARENGVVIERDFADGPLDVPGDRDELFQVFENLLENACKYGQSGGRVMVSIARSDAGPEPGIDVTIRDFGPGIRRGAHSAHHRALLPRRCRDQPHPERHRPRPVHRQAHPDAPQRPAVDQVGSRQGRGVHGSFAGALRRYYLPTGLFLLSVIRLAYQRRIRGNDSQRPEDSGKAFRPCSPCTSSAPMTKS